MGECGLSLDGSGVNRRARLPRWTGIAPANRQFHRAAPLDAKTTFRQGFREAVNAVLRDQFGRLIGLSTVALATERNCSNAGFQGLSRTMGIIWTGSAVRKFLIAAALLLAFGTASPAKTHVESNQGCKVELPDEEFGSVYDVAYWVGSCTENKISGEGDLFILVGGMPLE